MKRFMVFMLVLLALGCSTGHDFSKIEPAGQKQIELIGKGLDHELTIVKGCAVKSSSHKDSYYVSALVNGPQKADVGVWWISGAREKPGLILAVDGFAFVYSSYPRARKTWVGARATDDEVKLLKAYLSQGNE